MPPASDSPKELASLNSLISTPRSGASATTATSLEDFNEALVTSMVAGFDLDGIRDDLVSVALKAGDMMLEADPTDSSSAKKNTSDRVTDTDRAIEAMVQDSLANKYPDIDFLGEETFKDGQELGYRATFVCDPIDGTLNFIHGFPNVAISIALTVAKIPFVGVVYNPFRRDIFSAIKGRGAFLKRGDQHPVQLPLRRAADAIDGINDCLVAVEWGTEREGKNWELRTRVVNKLLSSKTTGGAMAHSIRSSGSAALDFCYVAAGWIDIFWEGGCWIWDICAGWIILQEAKGFIAGANEGEWEPSLEGRSYLAVRAAPSGQREAVEELWRCLDGGKFVFKQPSSK